MKMYSELPALDEANVKGFFNRLVVLKLNGGLGAVYACVSMRC